MKNEKFALVVALLLAFVTGRALAQTPLVLPSDIPAATKPSSVVKDLRTKSSVTLASTPSTEDAPADSSVKNRNAGSSTPAENTKKGPLASEQMPLAR